MKRDGAKVDAAGRITAEYELSSDRWAGHSMRGLDGKLLRVARSKRKLVAAAAFAVVALLALSGCSALSHVSAELKGGSVGFTYCDEKNTGVGTINRIEVYADPISSGKSSDTPIWVSVGTSGVHARQVVTYGIAPPGFADVRGPTAFNPKRSKIEVAFVHAKGPEDIADQRADFDGSKLVEGKRLNWNGNIVDSPCGG
jgi:hypothetical protein